MFWIALHFPQLAIDCVSRGHGETLIRPHLCCA
jgi:hypothetical protein